MIFHPHDGSVFGLHVYHVGAQSFGDGKFSGVSQSSSFFPVRRFDASKLEWGHKACEAVTLGWNTVIKERTDGGLPAGYDVSQIDSQ